MLVCLSLFNPTAYAADDAYTADNGLAGSVCGSTLYLPPYSTAENKVGYLNFTLPDTNPDNGRKIGGYDFWPANTYFPGTSAPPSFSLQPGTHTLSCGMSGMDGAYHIWIDNPNPGGYAKPDGGIKIQTGSYVTGVTYSSPAPSNPPTITAPKETRLTVGDSFEPMQGVTANDTEDGDLTSSVTYTPSRVDTSKPGTTVVTYTVTDSSGKTATAIRTVIVEAATVTEHTLTFDPQGGSMRDPTSQTVPVGQKPTKPSDPTKNGASFDGWYLINGKQYDFSQPLEGDLTIFAKWIENATTIACAPSTGDPAASIRQSVTLLAGMLTFGMAALTIRRHRKTQRSI